MRNWKGCSETAILPFCANKGDMSLTTTKKSRLFYSIIDAISVAAVTLSNTMPAETQVEDSDNNMDREINFNLNVVVLKLPFTLVAEASCTTVYRFSLISSISLSSRL